MLIRPGVPKYGCDTLQQRVMVEHASSIGIIFIFQCGLKMNTLKHLESTATDLTVLVQHVSAFLIQNTVSKPLNSLMLSH